MSNIVRAERMPKPVVEQAPAKQSEIRRVVGLMGRFMAGQRRQFVLAGLMLIIETLAAVLIPLLIAYLITYLTARLAQLGGKAVLPPLTPLAYLGLPTVIDQDIDTVVLVTIGLVVLEMINSAADSMTEIFLARGGRLMGLNLRVGLYAHLQRLSLAFYNQQRTGDLLTRVTSDVTALEDFVTTSLSDIVGSILLIGFILVTMTIFDWRVALVALLFIPIMATISNYFSQRIKSTSKKQRAREGELAASAQEMLTSIRVIQTYGRAGNQEQRFAAQSRKTMDSALEAAGLQARFSWSVSVLEAVATAAIIWLGVWLLFGSIATPNPLGIGVLTAFIKYIQDMFKPTKKIIKEWNTFGKIYASVERIGDLFDRKPAVQDEPGSTVAPALNGHIEYRHVSFAYQAEPADGVKETGEQLRLALRDVSLGISPGEVLALVGGSGAGKSTIVQLLPRLYDPHAGQVTIDGHDIREWTLDSLRAQMSMVLQESILFTGTIAENIAYGLENATREEIIAAAIQANAHEFIEKLPKGYDTELGERAATLSGGQRQRLAIARAFIRNTPILILDEPTTGLDAESTELVLLALRSLMKGKSTLIISHDLNLIRHADKIVVIKQGEIAQVGAHKELLRAGGLYADLYHKQFGQAVEEQGGKLAPATPVAEEEDEEAEPVTPQFFQTMMTQALPKPVSAQVFQTMMVQALPPLAASAAAAAPSVAAIAQAMPASVPAVPTTHAPQPAPAALAGSAATPTPASSTPAVPTTHAPQPVPAMPVASAATPAPASLTPAVPTASAAQSTPAAPAAAPVVPSTPAAEPAVSAASAAPPQPAVPTPSAATPTPASPTPVKPAIFETTLMRTIPLPVAVPSDKPAVGATTLQPAVTAPAVAGLAAVQRDDGAFDPLRSPELQRELPGLVTVFDAEAMREHLQSVLFGKTRAGSIIERCVPGQAIYHNGCCVLRYQLTVKDEASGQTSESLVVGRVFQNQFDCAVYMRDKLAPLVELMYDRPEIAQFATPIAMIEPLHMVVSVFPIDGELPAIIGATDPDRMIEVFAETLPDALDEQLTVEDCRVELVNYRRQHRCVLRYEITGKDPNGQAAAPQVVYGKISDDGTAALAGPVIAALRENVPGAGREFNLPRSFGYRPDLHLALLEGIPGSPRIAPALKARLKGAPEMDGALPLEAMIETCGQIAAALHTSEIKLGSRRTLDDELTALRADFADVQRISPDLGAQLYAWLDRIDLYAEESDALASCFSHGDFTYTQLIFDDTTAGLVDFDTVCQAEPALDLGQFLAYLRVATLKAHKSGGGSATDIAGQLAERFMRAYIAAAGERIEDEERLRVRVSVYQIVSLLRMALHSWHKLKGARIENVITVIEEEIACLPQLNY